MHSQPQSRQQIGSNPNFYSPVGGTRRRSHSASRSLTDSTVQFMGRIGQSLRMASSSSSSNSRRQQKKEADIPNPMEQLEQQQPAGVGRRQSLAEQWFRTVRLRRRSDRLAEQGIGVRSEELGRKQFDHDMFRQPPSIGDEEEEDMEMFALVPPQALLDDHEQQQQQQQFARAASPLSSSSGFGGGGGSRSCPATPRPLRRRYLKEGFCQLTSIQTLSHHHRYMFLFDDLLLVCKQKGENSYKLKEKVALEFLWLSSNNCTNSFLLGWPTARNYIAHFSSEREKADWFEKLNAAIQRRLRPKNTTVGVFVQIEGRHQLIRHSVRNGQKADDLVEQLRQELNLPVLDPHLGQYQLCFCPGTLPKRGRHPSSGFLLVPSESLLPGSKSATASPAILRRVHSHSCIVAPIQQQLPAHQQQQPNHQGGAVHQLHGVENVYAVLMEFVRNQLGISLSDSQLAHLDTCPLVNCRLLLRQTGPYKQHNGNNSSSSSSSIPTHKSAAFSLVSQFRRVLGRAESAASNAAAANGGQQKPKAQKRLFGRQLRGSMPPQPILTMVDHLLLYGADVEGIFRKSPKQQTVRALRQQLDQGQVPDFHQFNAHVTASLLKDYLRSIPGQLLLSGNYPLWMDALQQPNAQEQLSRCRRLLALLPPAHTVLLRSLLRLLRKVATNEQQTKMGVSALAVCIAPSLLEKLDQVESVRVVPELVIFLVQNAPALFDGFLEDGPLLAAAHSPLAAANYAGQSPMHQSTDSGLSEIGTTAAMGAKRRMFLGGEHRQQQPQQQQRSISPDSGKLSSEPPSEDDADCRARRISPSRWMKTHSLDEEELDCGFGRRKLQATENIEGDEEEEDEAERLEDKTPVVLSRENSDVKDTCWAPSAAKAPTKFAWHSDQLDNNSSNNNGQQGQGNSRAQARLPLSRSGGFLRCENGGRNSTAALSPQPLIVGSRKCSTNSSAFAADRNLSSPTGTATPRKVSTASVASTGSQQSGGNASNGMAALSRRALLLVATKSEALGIDPAAGEASGRERESRKSSLASSNGNCGGRLHNNATNKQQPQQQQQMATTRAQLQRAQAFNNNNNGVQSPSSCRTSAAHQQNFCWPTAHSATNSLVGSALSSASPSPSLSERAFVNNGPASSALRRYSASTTANPSVGTVRAQLAAQQGGENNQRRASSGQMLTAGGMGQKRQQQQKYIPHKRTAEELLLDKLEVNWSVPQIRKQFQQHSANAQPPVIDTLYAKLPAGQPSIAAVGGPK